MGSPLKMVSFQPTIPECPMTSRSGKSPRRPRSFRTGLLLLVLIPAGCGGGGQDLDALQERIGQDLYTTALGTISEEDAHCAAGVFIEILGPDQAEIYASALTGDMEAAGQVQPMTEEQQLGLGRALERCDFTPGGSAF